MNEIAFGTKRAFQACLRVSRKLLASFGLTAARFDLLYAIARESPEYRDPPRISQVELRALLGVSAPVVSRLLGALESLGWVTRERYTMGDRRKKVVTFTRAGLSRFKRATHVVLRCMDRLVSECITLGRRRDWSARVGAMDSLEGLLRLLRRDFGDGARLYFPWGHPDD